MTGATNQDGDKQIQMNDEQLIRAAIEIARSARKKGNHPFGALLVDREGRLLLEAENTVETEHDCTGHAETNLIRKAWQKYDREFLASCSLYTSTEPCAMCAGAIFWGNVGRVVFGLSETRLYEVVGDKQEGVLMLPCREVFARGKRSIEVIGPMLEEEAIKVHQGFWR
jgi:tRNA(Arg) A34 adenosine deaminase TadA